LLQFQQNKEFGICHKTVNRSFVILFSSDLRESDSLLLQLVVAALKAV